MAKKWRVSLDRKVLGHYAGRTPEEAVKKAHAKHYNFYDGDSEQSPYLVTKAGVVDAPVYEVGI